MYSTSQGGYWRHMGWGQPAAGNGVVHYVYDSRNTGNGDPGNVFYIRSTDGGVTFSAPFQLNTDTTTRAQWQPNISAGADGSLLAVWYDERETTTCTKGNTTVPCYQNVGAQVHRQRPHLAGRMSRSRMKSARCPANLTQTLSRNMWVTMTIAPSRPPTTFIHGRTVAWPSAAAPSRMPLSIESQSQAAADLPW